LFYSGPDFPTPNGSTRLKGLCALPFKHPARSPKPSGPSVAHSYVRVAGLMIRLSEPPPNPFFPKPSTQLTDDARPCSFSLLAIVFSCCSLLFSPNPDSKSSLGQPFPGSCHFVVSLVKASPLLHDSPKPTHPSPGTNDFALPGWSFTTESSAVSSPLSQSPPPYNFGGSGDPVSLTLLMPRTVLILQCSTGDAHQPFFATSRFSPKIMKFFPTFCLCFRS